MTRDQLFAHNIRLPEFVTFEEVWSRIALNPLAFDWTNPLTLFSIKYRFDATRFVREVIGVDPDPKQVELLDAASSGARQIAARSGHGVGKTAVVSWLNLWFICVFNPAKAIVTAPAAGTITDGIGAEIVKWHNRMPETIKALFDVKSDRIELIADRKGTFLSMRTTRPENPQTLAGIHEEHVLLTVDEASALPDATFESAGGSMTSPHAIMLLIGNPTRRDGYFYDCFHKTQDEWVCIHISCLDSSRVTPQYPASIEKRYGRESNQYRVRVLGEFPLGNDDSAIPMWMIEATVERDVQALQVTTIWGLDVARSLERDSSVLTKRRGNVMLPTDPELLKDPRTRHSPATMRWQFADTAQLIGVIKREWDNTPETQRPSAICVDGIGFGATVADVLRSYGLPAMAINVSERKGSSDEFLNLKAELWFGEARAWFANMLSAMPRDPKLMEELATPNYHHTPIGQIIIEDKDAIRKRKGWSPDGGDSWVLTFAAPAAATVPGQPRMGWNQPLPRRIKGMV